MSVRTVCFILAVLISGPLRWVLLAASFFLPYIAVVMANTANPRIPGTDLLAPDRGHRELG